MATVSVKIRVRVRVSVPENGYGEDASTATDRKNVYGLFALASPAMGH